ncbi:precorrin-6A/cobalt-precorrin-6A reductase [Roseospira goensis]|uniref:Precorrin-6A/cobalt-precorrin-6A reductase n=2 Tax=Roseospira goensis TaxID=391922 RepID=A0A7W6RY60_9PROT|nr:precorrin-6A/cobalt-precorrin-6A reductase [Roseospira goensis]
MAAALSDHALFTPVSSLAGRTDPPRHPPGEVRVGGFGGFMGLARYLGDAEIAAVIDATHPFAERMGWNAATACALAGRPLLRLERPPWRPGQGDRWTAVETWDEAVAHLEASGARSVFLPLGGRDLDAFAGLSTVSVLIRAVDAHDPPPPLRDATVITARGPFTVEGETALLRDHAIDAVVCRNSGGPAGAKLAAARSLGIPVIMRRRPPRPVVPRVASVPRAVSWLETLT